jgi:hypothetical protein
MKRQMLVFALSSIVVLPWAVSQTEQLGSRGVRHRALIARSWY